MLLKVKTLNISRLQTNLILQNIYKITNFNYDY